MNEGWLIGVDYTYDGNDCWVYRNMRFYYSICLGIIWDKNKVMDDWLV